MIGLKEHIKVYIILINHNNWIDTLECLESLMKSTYNDFEIVICDNSESNISCNYIMAWANGMLEAVCSNKLRSLVYPYCKKKIDINYLSEKKYLHKKENNNINAKITLIRLENNNGFSAGNNVGINYAKTKEGENADYALWFLNNDTVIQDDTLSEMIKMLKNNPFDVVGSKICYYHNPEIIQTLGGKRNRWNWLKYESIGDGENIDFSEYEKIDIITGMSFLVSSICMREMEGIFDERYFLYCEEIELQERVNKLNKGKLIIATKGVVYHKGGESTDGKSRDFLVYCSTYSYLQLYKKWHPFKLPYVIFLFFLKIIFYKYRGRNVYPIFKAIINILEKEKK